jgi:hypothetical protein
VWSFRFLIAETGADSCAAAPMAVSPPGGLALCSGLCRVGGAPKGPRGPLGRYESRLTDGASRLTYAHSPIFSRTRTSRPPRTQRSNSARMCQ